MTAGALAFGAAFFLAGASAAGSGAGAASGAGEEATFARGVRLGLAGVVGGSAATGAAPPIFGRGLGVSRLATRSAVALGVSGMDSGSGWGSGLVWARRPSDRGAGSSAASEGAAMASPFRSAPPLRRRRRRLRLAPSPLASPPSASAPSSSSSSSGLALSKRARRRSRSSRAARWRSRRSYLKASFLGSLAPSPRALSKEMGLSPPRTTVSSSGRPFSRCGLAAGFSTGTSSARSISADISP